MNIYQERLLDHYRYSPHRGSVPACSFSSGMHNPSCGDSIILTGLIHNGIVELLMFEGTGCVISQGVASLICETNRGRTVAELDQYGTTELMTLVGMPLGPTRMKCALLSLDALREGLSAYRMHDAKEKHARSCQIDARDPACYP